MDHLKKVIRKDLVIGNLQKINFEKSRLCDAYKKGKQVRAFF